MSVQLGWLNIKVLGYRQGIGDVVCGAALTMGMEVSDRKFLGYWRVGGSAVGSYQAAGEHEGSGEGGVTCPCSCLTEGSWASGCWRLCC